MYRFIASPNSYTPADCAVPFRTAPCLMENTLLTEKLSIPQQTRTHKTQRTHRSLRQIVDTGLDYNSCFFVDRDGKEVAHGHFFEEIGVEASTLSSWSPSFSKNPPIAQVFTGGNFNYNLGRRKVLCTSTGLGHNRRRVARLVVTFTSRVTVLHR